MERGRLAVRNKGIFMQIAAPKITEKVGALRLTEFKPAPFSKQEGPTRAFNFYDTVPLALPTMDFPVIDPKPAPRRVESKRFGEFKIQPEINLAKETPQVEQQLTVVRRELQSMVTPKIKEKPLETTEPIKAEPLMILKTEPSTAVPLHEKVDGENIAIHPAENATTASVSAKTSVNNQELAVQKSQGKKRLVQFGKKPKREKKRMKFMKDMFAMIARQNRAMLTITWLYAEKIYNTFGRYTGLENYTFSGKELVEKIGRPTDDMVSGLAKKLHTKDKTLESITSEISQMPQTTSVTDAAFYVSSIIDSHPAVDFKPENEAKGEEEVSKRAIAEVIFDALTL